MVLAFIVLAAAAILLARRLAFASPASRKAVLMVGAIATILGAIATFFLAGDGIGYFTVAVVGIAVGVTSAALTAPYLTSRGR
jgi:hypothetical protein